MNLHQHPLIRLLDTLRLPAADYVIFGSGPLLAHGIRTHLGDLDLVARGTAWNLCARIAAPRPAPSGHGHMIRLHGGALEIVDRWLTAAFDTDQLIDNADHIDGLPFARITDVVASKRHTNRPKDRADLALIHTALTGSLR